MLRIALRNVLIVKTAGADDTGRLTDNKLLVDIPGRFTGTLFITVGCFDCVAEDGMPRFLPRTGRETGTVTILRRPG